MTHSIKVFRPTYSQYAEIDTLMNMISTIILVVLGIMHLFLWGIAFFGLFTALPSLALVGGLYYLSHTHEEKKMDLAERKLLWSYNNLDPEVRAKIPLDVSTIITIGKNEEQFWEVEREINRLINEQKERKKAEARLDPTSVVVLDSIRTAQEEEKQYTHEIRKVLGDFDKAETPQERLKLAEKIRTQLTRR